MHELSIAVSLVEIAMAELARLRDVRVSAVHVRVGPLAGVVADALHFSFDVAAEGTALAGARLEIEDVPPVVWCDHCAAERVLSSVARRRCPVCDAPTPELVRGDELELVALEVTDP